MKNIPVSEQPLLKPGVKFNNHFGKWREFVEKHLKEKEQEENKKSEVSKNGKKNV